MKHMQSIKWMIGAVWMLGACGESATEADTETAAGEESDAADAGDSDSASESDTETALEGDGPQTEIPEGREVGDFLGEVNNTYYWFLEESDYSADETVTLVDESCESLVAVDADFAADVCLEGSGRLNDGSIVNLTGTCDCGFPCGDEEEGTCFYLPDSETFPWGVGSADNPLVPLVSVAANDLPFGQVLYVPAFDGVEIPEVEGLGGIVHDGCFRVDDEGYSFDDTHIDIFAGTPRMYAILESLLPTFVGLDAYDGAAHCFPDSL